MAPVDVGLTMFLMDFHQIFDRRSFLFSTIWDDRPCTVCTKCFCFLALFRAFCFSRLEFFFHRAFVLVICYCRPKTSAFKNLVICQCHIIIENEAKKVEDFEKYNKENGIIPQPIIKKLNTGISDRLNPYSVTKTTDYSNSKLNSSQINKSSVFE